MSLVPPPSTDAAGTAAGTFAGAEAILAVAESLASECFADIRAISTSYESDPETGERWIELRLTVGATDERAVADAYDRYAARWVAVVPWPQHNLVRLSYLIV
jgi:hypothetical protein